MFRGNQIELTSLRYLMQKRQSLLEMSSPVATFMKLLLNYLHEMQNRNIQGIFRCFSKGEDGVKKVLQILKDELERAMRLSGTPRHILPQVYHD